MTDSLDLERFVHAQAGSYDIALRELVAGAKRSHWMWFIFPQVAGLGHSEMSRRFAIRDRAEATAYLAHPVLGPRLYACADALLQHASGSAFELLGSPDDLKLRSSATLFAEVDDTGVFVALLERFFEGARDESTLALLRTTDGAS